LHDKTGRQLYTAVVEICVGFVIIRGSGLWSRDHMFDSGHSTVM